MFISVLFSLGIVAPAFAQQPNSHADIPEKNGDYPDPENPKLRVRVFVHEPKSQSTLPIITCTDDDSTAVVGTTGWHLPATVTYKLNTSSVPASVGAVNFATKIAPAAFSAWQDATGGKVTFSQGPTTSVNRNQLDFQNIVSWGRTSSSALAVTYTRYYTATKEVADVDTIFNSKFPWAWTDPTANACSLYANAYDAQDILTHETGHWMGLNDTYASAYVNNTMYGYGDKGEVKKDTLTTGDKANLPTIYP